MHDPRLSTALRQLPDLGRDPVPSRWRWSIAGIERVGRITLPGHALTILDANARNGTTVRGRCHPAALVLHRDGAGAAMSVDARGRMSLPAWVRDSYARPDAVLIGSCANDGLVVIAPVQVLDAFGDRLADRTGD